MEIDYLKKLTQPIFYLTNDVSRGVGLETILPNYHIICLDDHPLVDYLKEAGVSVFCLERELGKKNILVRISGNILAHPAVLAFIKEKAAGKTPQILFFKPQRKIEILGKTHGFSLLGNQVELNRRFEDKVAFFGFCQKMGIKTVPGEIADLGSLNFKRVVRQYGEILTLQFGRGWAGSSTFFVKSEDELSNLQKDFGDLRVKVGRFISGLTILNNAVVFGRKVLVSQPALQIKSHPLLTSAPGGTGGRQWPAGITAEQEEKIEEMTQKIGKLMADEGYRGFFGLDFLIEDDSGEIFVSENNARLTASVPFYTKQELALGAFPLLGYHLLSFLETPAEEEWQAPKVEGSEIVLRNTAGSLRQIRQTLPPGIYRFPLEFEEKAYFLPSGVKGKFWLTAAAEGRRLNPEIELARINVAEAVCNARGELKAAYLDLAEQVRKKLPLQAC